MEVAKHVHQIVMHVKMQVSNVNAIQDIIEHKKKHDLIDALVSFEQYMQICDHFIEPPTKPRNVRLVDSDQTSASFEWDEPTSNGGRRELWYRWRCDGCPPDVAATPPDHRFYTRSLSLSSLVAGTRYTLYLYAENDISAVVDGPPQPYHLIEFTTKQLSPLVVGNLRVESMTDTGVTLAWNAPTMGADDSAVLVDFYQLRYKMHGVPGVAEQLQTTKERHHSFTDLSPNRQYAFMVIFLIDPSSGCCFRCEH